MVAMDVVDTLRHQQTIVDRELDTEGRQERLLERLRKLYKAQGIEVSDQVLEEGIRALEEERFQYSKPESSAATRFAKWYVRRAKWGKPLVALFLIASVLAGTYYFTDVRPRQQAHAAIPNNIQSTLTEIRSVAKNPNVINAAAQQAASANAAFKAGKLQQARDLRAQMESTLSTLRHHYQLRIISRPNELSGVWRNTEVNSNARNYYLIVEAIDSNGKTLTLPITNEENGKIRSVDKWGVRVSRETFNSIADDKRDDGIIQANIVGKKTPGVLTVDYMIQTNGASITSW